MLNRREFLKGLCASSLLLPHTATALTSNNEVVLQKIDIPFKNLPVEFKGYKIAFVSDIHHGPFLQEKHFEDMLLLLKNNDYDLLLLGGDYLHIPEGITKRHIYPWHNQTFNRILSKEEMIKQIFRELSGELRSLRPKDGIFAVYGNHDQWLAPQITIDFFKDYKIELLINSSYTIKRGNKTLSIFGADDYWTGFPTTPPLINDKKNINCLIAHNPDFISDLLRNSQTSSLFNLALCGHTHGGQINLPIVGSIHNNIKDQRFSSGLVKTNNNQYVYTSRGVGTVEIPYRLNCPPEVTLITLV